MLLFLSLADSTKEEPNENYARELMELFTLGKGYTEKRHPRGRARADRLSRQAPRRRQRRGVLYDRKAHDATAQDDLRQARQLRLPRRARPRASPIRSTRRSSSRSCGSTSSARRSSARRARAWRGVYRRSSHRIKPVVARDPRAPRAVRAPRRARHGQVAGRLRRRARCARRGQGVDARRLGLAARRHGPAAVPPAVGRRLGVGPRVAVDEHDARALRRRQLPAADDGAARGRATARRRPTTRRARPSRAPARAVGRPWISAATDAQLLKLATRLLPTTGARAATAAASSAPTCASARCASCCSPAPTPSCTDDGPPTTPTAPATTSARPRSPRAGATSAARSSRAARCIGWGVGAGLSLYAAQAMPIARALEAAAADAAAAPDAPVLVSVFLPGGLDLLDSLIPLNDYGAYADLHRNVLRRQAAAAARQRARHPPVADAGRRRRHQGPLRRRQARLPARHRLRRTRTSRTSTRATSGRPA